MYAFYCQNDIFFWSSLYSLGSFPFEKKTSFRRYFGSAKNCVTYDSKQKLNIDIFQLEIINKIWIWLLIWKCDKCPLTTQHNRAISANACSLAIRQPKITKQAIDRNVGWFFGYSWLNECDVCLLICYSFLFVQKIS